MSFSFSPAVRDRVGLLISISGGTGSGKSLSGLKIARGLAAKPGEDLTNPATLAQVDARIAAIDTEAGRLKHYAPAPGEKPGPNTFMFMHGDMKAPFSPEAYSAGIAEIDKQGFEVAMVDSGSHIWAGDGGVAEMQEAALAEAVARAKANHERENRNYAFDEDKTRERLSMACWKAPKLEHKKFISRLLQSRCHVILCLRAEEKLLMETIEEEGSNGRKYKKTIITPAKDRPINERWQPICEKKLPFEFTVSLLLTADKPGYPIPLKLEEQHKAAVPLDRPLNEETGRKLAEWARGGAPAPKSEPEKPARPMDELVSAGDSIAPSGTAVLSKWFTESLTKTERQLLKAHIGPWKEIAAKVGDGAQASLPV